MIEEIKLNSVSNTLPTINKIAPRSINPDLTPCYFSACFVGAKNSGKSYGLCTFIKNYQDNPIKDHVISIGIIVRFQKMWERGDSLEKHVNVLKRLLVCQFTNLVMDGK